SILPVSPPPSYALLPFSFHSCAPHLVLHSFPTRRSSDLGSGCAVGHRSTADEEYAHHRSGGPGLDGETKLQSSAARFIRSHCALDRKSTRLNSSHRTISYAVFCLKKKKIKNYKHYKYYE